MARKDITDLMVCKAVYQVHQNGVKAGDRFLAAVTQLHGTTGEAEKVCHAAINRSIDRGLVEWGDS